MYRECDQCLDSSVEFANGGVVDDNSVVVWSEWALEQKEYEKDGATKTTRLTTKAVRRGTLKDLKEQMVESLTKQYCFMHTMYVTSTVHTGP